MIDKKTLDDCYKYLDRVVNLCQQPRLNLKNSPPYILDIIPDIYEKLQGILTFYQENFEILSQIDYFEIYIQSLIEKCKRTVNLFNESKEKIFDLNSVARSHLIKLSLIFSHLLKDLEALFPQNEFALSNFRITKPDAARWWSMNFGNKSIVPWESFKQSLIQTFFINHNNDNCQLTVLQNTIDLTGNHYISIFEFDVFTRLFQPWNNILETWKVLTVSHPGYMAFMTYDEVKSLLKRYRSHPGPGSFVFRLSCTKLGQWVIGYVAQDLRILQTIIQNKSLAQALIDGKREGFYLYPNGKPNPICLLYHLINNIPQIHLQVTQEQYQLYWEMSSSFELCKICDENNKNIQLEPCGHLICKHCLVSCQCSGNGQTCPFCRLEIKDIEEIIIDPYKPHKNLLTCRQISLPHNCMNKKSDSITNLINRSVSLDHSIGLLSSSLSSSSSPQPSNRLSCNLIDIYSMPPKPPPVPPRNVCNFCNHIKCNCLHSSVMGTDFPQDPLVNNNNFTVNTSTITTSITNTNNNGNNTIELARRNNFLNSNLKTDINCSLNYAQLDLNNSDSECELNERSDFHITNNQPTSSNLGGLNINYDTTSGPINTNNSAIINKDKHNGHNNNQLFETDECLVNNFHSNQTNSLLATSNKNHLIEHSYYLNRTYLRNTNPDMNEEIADLLLNITENRLTMALKIWEHFMPRSSNYNGS